MKKDDELKQLFQRQRAQDARRIPSFDGVLRRRRSKGRKRFSLVPAAAVVSVAVLAVGSWWLRVSPSPSSVETLPPSSLAATSWSMPSDFLLEVPGQELLGAPSLIAVEGWRLLDGPAATGSHATDSMEATRRQPPPKLTI